ncbi:MAG: EpsI family protein [Sphingopyxis sp.]|uniref:exosortase C-terminal domain/associated protein EpsI n=1 Tax=Sphingopyxis sp. TaxID=1908224 RepID=UPI002ABABC96|nr:exosortase C-terminal domain/associated protein EpsI [Sphingopyxis sp.]MDZ3833679.1 EpsI family protein [Sphingopyxis sp.]
MLIAFACAGSFATAEWLRPREHRLLLSPGKTLASIIPETFGSWHQDPNGSIVLPPTEGTLAGRLYDEMLVRSYADGSGQSPIMMLATYGKEQSDGLQLHRPESCYPAVGFAIVGRTLGALQLGRDVSLPVVRLTARLGERVEDIVYWTRLGDALPRTAGEQRRVRLETAIAGYIGDGVLVRASAVRTNGRPEFTRIDALLTAMLSAVSSGSRQALIGTGRAANLVRQAP